MTGSFSPKTRCRPVGADHFTGMHDLLGQVVRTVCEDGVRYVTGRTAAQQSTAEIPAACLRTNIEFIRGHGSGIAAVDEIARNVQAVDPSLDQAAGGSHRDESILQGHRVDLRSRRDDREFRACDTRRVASAIRTGLEAQRRTPEPAPDFEAGIAKLTTVFTTASRINT